MLKDEIKKNLNVKKNSDVANVFFLTEKKFKSCKSWFNVKT
jgi:hypothetical protein